MPIQAVLFDLGETLLQFGRVDADILFAAGARLTYDYLGRFTAAGRSLPPFQQYRRQNTRAIRLYYLWSNLTNREFDCLALLERRVRALGVQLEQSDLIELAWLWYQPLGAQATVEPDLHRSLAELQQLGVQLAVVSNTFLPAPVLDRQLARFDLLRFFPVRCYSSMTVFRKPDRRIFHRALRALNVPPAATVMVGDQRRPDIKGALRAGMKAVFKRGSSQHPRNLPPGVPVIERIAELPALIRSWEATVPAAPSHPTALCPS